MFHNISQKSLMFLTQWTCTSDLARTSSTKRWRRPFNKNKKRQTIWRGFPEKSPQGKISVLEIWRPYLKHNRKIHTFYAITQTNCSNKCKWDVCGLLPPILQQCPFLLTSQSWLPCCCYWDFIICASLYTIAQLISCALEMGKAVTTSCQARYPSSCFI